jgi:hypothetical protein
MVVLALGALTATSALAAGAPIVETKAATGITETTATLTGSITANGAETKYYFEYGPTTSYGSKTTEHVAPTKGVGSGTAKGLTVFTTYHFRVVATNSYGTSYGADEVFTATPEKPYLVVSSGKVSEFEFKAKGGGPNLEWGGAKTLGCSESSFTGHFINARELEGNMRWTECSGNGGKSLCFNERTIENGYFHGWVQSETLKGTLGYINKANKEVGIKLSGASSEVWANNVDCRGNPEPLNGSLGGQLNVPVNTKIPRTQALSIVYTEKEDKQITGELGGQLLWPNSSWPFGIEGRVEGKANLEFEIQA